MSVTPALDVLGVSVSDPFGAASDPRMGFLALALDPLEVRWQFAGQLPHLASRLGEYELRSIRVARHKPGRRCLIEYSLQGTGGEETTQLTLVGKARAKGVDHLTYALGKALWNGAFGPDSADGVRVPEPIGVIPEFKMWLQVKVPGILATRLLPEPSGGALARRIAEAIYKLHQANISSSHRHTMADELRLLHERLALVAQANPAWADRLVRILDACDRLGAATPEPSPQGIHRDFYSDHVIVGGADLYLLDLDLYCDGNPGVDIGNFVAHLIERGLRLHGDSCTFDETGSALEERFVELAGSGTRAAIRAYATLTLVRHIFLSTQFPDRRPFTRTLLELCEARLGCASV